MPCAGREQAQDRVLGGHARSRTRGRGAAPSSEARHASSAARVGLPVRRVLEAPVLARPPSWANVVDSADRRDHRAGGRVGRPGRRGSARVSNPSARVAHVTHARPADEEAQHVGAGEHADGVGRRRARAAPAPGRAARPPARPVWPMPIVGSAGPITFSTGASSTPGSRNAWSISASSSTSRRRPRPRRAAARSWRTGSWRHAVAPHQVDRPRRTVLVGVHVDAAAAIDAAAGVEHVGDGAGRLPRRKPKLAIHSSLKISRQVAAAGVGERARRRGRRGRASRPTASAAAPPCRPTRR